VKFRHLVVEGAAGVGKTAVSQRLAERLDARVALEDPAANPFLKSFYDGAPGASFSAEMFFLLSRYRQQQELRQGALFQQATVGDTLFEKSRLYAFLNLDDAELALYEKLWTLLAETVPKPDLVVYLQAPTDVLWKRLRARAGGVPVTEEYLAEVNRAYNHYFFHYTQTPLLVVNTADVDFERSKEDLDDVVRQIKNMGRGTRYYVPLGSRSI
jgi:deoxyadenosine/deoxycytidine kinase